MNLYEPLPSIPPLQGGVIHPYGRTDAEALERTPEEQGERAAEKFGEALDRIFGVKNSKKASKAVRPSLAAAH